MRVTSCQNDAQAIQSLPIDIHHSLFTHPPHYFTPFVAYVRAVCQSALSMNFAACVLIGKRDKQWECEILLFESIAILFERGSS